MEEVDTIIVRQLKAIECDIEEDKSSLKELDMTEMINSASKCLFLITKSSGDGGHEFSSYASIDNNSNMATKYKLANELASQINSLGYRLGSRVTMSDGQNGTNNNLGYQTFLYGSHSEFRNMFLFLISKLPKGDSGQDVSVSRSFGQVLRDRIKRQVSENDIWLPPMVCDSDTHIKQFPDCDKPLHLLWDKRWQDFTVSAVKKLDMTISGVHKEENLKQGSSEIVAANTATELNFLEAKLESVKEQLRLKETSVQEKKSSLDHCSSQLKEEHLELIQLKHSDISMESLEGAVTVLNQDMDTLRVKWTELESELLNEKDSIESVIRSKTSESDLIKEQLNRIKNQIKINSVTIQEKEMLLESLKESIPSKGVPTRKSYTKRILEIISNYKKQIDTTKKIMAEIKDHQKDINGLTGKVSRSFAICDDTIYKSGERLERIDPEFYRKSYKLLANLHDMNTLILTGLESIGTIKRDILKTEQQIEKEEGEKIDEKLDKITKDLTAIKSLNSQLSSGSK